MLRLPRVPWRGLPKPRGDDPLAGPVFRLARGPDLPAYARSARGLPRTAELD